MPVMNGFETCKTILSNDKLKEIPVIFLTAYADLDNKVAGLDIGAKDYITKPFNSKELLSRVKTHVDLKRSMEKLNKVNEWLQEKVEEKTKELVKANNELNKLDDMKNKFLVMISQEIRVPINGITGTINLIKNKEHSSAIKDLIETLDISIASLENFTDKALLLTQLTSSKYNLELTEIELKELLQYAIIELNEPMKKKGLEIISEKTSTSPILKADKDLLFKALVYILQNAIQFSPPYGKIHIKTDTEGSKVVCTIEDNGNGLSPEEMARVFEPFQFDNVMMTSKISLSLYIVKQIMELHNGEINIQNKTDGTGARVTLSFNS